jgi:hypothetical protein
MNFVVNNEGKSQTKSSIHSTSTRNKHHLHRADASFSCFQKSTFHTGIRIFNSLPCNVTSLKNEKAEFTVALRRYVSTQSFDFVNECLVCKDDA